MRQVSFLVTPFGLIHNGHQAHGLVAGTTLITQEQFGKTTLPILFLTITLVTGL